MSLSDKQRYDIELALFKKGQFTAATAKRAIQPEANDSENRNIALEINDEIFRIIQSFQNQPTEAAKLEEMPDGVSQEEREALMKDNHNNENRPTSNENVEASQPMIPLNHENNNMINPNMMPSIDQIY